MPWTHRLILCLLLPLALTATGCRKKSENRKSGKKQREEAIKNANDEQAALTKFTGSVREILTWYQAQPVASEAERAQTRKAMAEKMGKVPVKDLPDDLAKAWIPMREAWQALAKAGSPDASLREQGARAAEELNRQLTARGVTGIRF